MSDGAARPSRLARVVDLLPDVWALVRPRLALLLGALALLAAGRAAGLVLPASMKLLVDEVLSGRRPGLLLPLLAAVVAAVGLQAGSSFVVSRSLARAAQQAIAEMRCRVQAHVTWLPVGFFDRSRAGELASRIMSDVEGVRNLIGTGMVDLVGGLLTATLALVAMLWISPHLTAISLGALLAYGALLLRSLARLRAVFAERGRLHAQVLGRLAESLSGVRVVKAYVAEGRESAVFSAGVRRIWESNLGVLDCVAALGAWSTLILGIAGGWVVYAGAQRILSGTLSLGDFVTFVMLVGLLGTPLLQVVAVGTQLTESLCGLERTRELLRERPEHRDPRRDLILERVRGEVVFEDVRFAYPGSPEVLAGVSFVAAPGRVTALVGPTGAGKSTIASLVAAFLAPTGGRVLVDGADLSRVTLDSYRRHLGLVLQDTFLFAGTIRENVAFSRPEAPPEETLEACRLAGLDPLAQTLDHGYDTVVGERGVTLSGGQRQQIALARALLADPRILVLDEATSSLDSGSEALIQERIGKLIRGRTTVMVAHRLSTVRLADEILVLEAGQIVEYGSHEALLAAAGRYREMWARQQR